MKLPIHGYREVQRELKGTSHMPQCLCTASAPSAEKLPLQGCQPSRPTSKSELPRFSLIPSEFLAVSGKREGKSTFLLIGTYFFP